MVSSYAWLFLVLILTLMIYGNYTQDLFFRLNGKTYAHNSAVFITDIGEGNHSLMCITDYINYDCCREQRNGEWTYPNRSIIPTNNIGHGFYRNRGERVVRLHRRHNTMSPVGMFTCQVEYSNERITGSRIILTAITGVTIVSSNNVPEIGQTYSLTCNAIGVEFDTLNSAINYRWSKSHSNITEIGRNFIFPHFTLSNAGQYLCNISVISEFYNYSLMNTRTIQIQIPEPSITIVTLPASRPTGFYTGLQLTLICTIVFATEVDIPVRVTTHWTRARSMSSIISNRYVNITMTMVQVEPHVVYQSNLSFSSLNKDREEEDIYKCTVVVEPEEAVHVRSISIFAIQSVDIDVAMFQIRLLGINNCEHWKMVNVMPKSDDLSSEVARQIQQPFGTCTFSAASIKRRGFQCFSDSPDAITFRAELHGTDCFNTQDLISVLDSWVAEGPQILVHHEFIRIDSQCTILINLTSDEECTVQPPVTLPPITQPPTTHTTELSDNHSDTNGNSISLQFPASTPTVDSMGPTIEFPSNVNQTTIIAGAAGIVAALMIIAFMTAAIVIAVTMTKNHQVGFKPKTDSSTAVELIEMHPITEGPITEDPIMDDIRIQEPIPDNEHVDKVEEPLYINRQPLYMNLSMLYEDTKPPQKQPMSKNVPPKVPPKPKNVYEELN